MKKRIIAMFLSVAMLLVTATNGLYLDTTIAQAAETPNLIKMPVVIYDHLADNLLFEYDLAGASYFALEDLGELTGQSEGKGLVETTLGENGTPVYKKEVVEAVANMVKTYMEEGHNVDNDLYNELVSRIVIPGMETDLISKDIYDADLERLGWNFTGLTYAEIDGDDCWIDADNNIIWYRTGDQLYTNGGTDNKAVFDFGELEAGTYTLSMYSFENINIEVTGNGFSTIIDEDNKTFTVPSKGQVKLTVYAKNNSKGQFIAPNLEKDGVKIYKNFTKNQALEMKKLGWVYPETSTWGTDTYGGMSCGDGEKSVAYKVVDVTARRTYELSVGHNENDLCGISITDMNGNVLAKEGEAFVIPEGVNQIKVVVSCMDNPEGKYRRLDNMSIKMFPSAALGNYADSKVKFDNGAKFDDITTCMDYAYYMLNTFWTDTYGDVTQKTDLYKTITLRRTDGFYKFSSSNTPVFDLETGDIAYGTEAGDGFYPLDKSVIGDKSDLTAPFGEGEIENPYDDMMHNYHFSLKVNCEFLYEESKNLEFGFRGDDDVYVYIDGKLVMDLGGAHLNRDDSFKLNDLADELGLVDGEVYSFDFFYMERHTTASNLKIETNMIFTPAEARPEINIIDKSGEVIEDPAKLEVGKEVGLDYAVTAGNDDMSNITFNDTTLGVVIGKDGIDLGNEDIYVKDSITVNVYDKDGNVKETITISKEDLNNPNKVKEFSDKVGQIVINTDESVSVSGLYKEVEPEELIKSTLIVDITAPQGRYDDNGHFIFEDTPVTIIPVERTIIPVTNPEATLDVMLVDDNGNQIFSEVNENSYVGVNYKVTAGEDRMKNISISDAGTGFSIDKDGIVIPEGYNVDNGLTVTLKRVDGTEETVALSKEDIENKAGNYNQLLSNLSDGWMLNEGDSVEITGLNTTIVQGEITSNATATVDGQVYEYNEETGELITNYETVSPSDVETVSTKAASNVLFTVNADTGSLIGNTTDRVNNGETTGKQPVVMPEEGFEFVKWTQTVGGITTDVIGEPKDVVINADTVFTAILMPKEYEYVVKYVDKATGEELAESKTAQAVFGTEVKETAIEIENYTVVSADEQSLTMKISGNEIIFEYEINKMNVVFETDGNGTLDGASSQTVDYGTKADDVIPKANEGYSFDSWTMINSDGEQTVENPADIEIKEDTTFVANFTPNTYDYVVKYIDKETGEEIADSKKASATFGTEVTEEAISIPHYGVSGDAEKTITMKTSGNEIIFEYEIGKLNVTFETDGNGTLEGEASQTVNYGAYAKDVTPKANEGYSFVGWEMTNSEGTKVVENPAEVEIKEDTTFTAIFKANTYDYVVKYIDKETGKEIATSKTDSAKYGTEIKENAIEIEGYTLSNQAEQSIVVKTKDNEIVFEYDVIKLDVDFTNTPGGSLEGTTDQTVDYGKNPSEVTPVPDEGYSFDGWTKTDSNGTEKVEDPSKVEIKEDTTFVANFTPNTYNYVVKYVDKATGEEIADSKKASATFGTDVTEEAINIEGYTLNGDEKQTTTIKVEGNEIIFQYDVIKLDVDYTNTPGGSLEGTTDQTVDYGKNPSEVTPVPDEGYSFDGWTKTDSNGTEKVEDPSKVEIKEDTTFEAVFIPNTYDYVVKYVDKATGEELAPSKNSQANFGKKVTEKAIDIKGYTVDGTDTKDVTIKVEGNEIVFEYNINKYNVNFVADENGTVEGKTEQVVDYKANAEATTPVANEGYSFNGWTMTTSEGTKAVVNPAEVEITENTTFTANFKANDYQYVVKYVDKATGEELLPSKSAQATFGTEVTEKAVEIEGYTLEGTDTKATTIKVEGNEIVFEYNINKFNVNFVADENGTVEGQTEQVVDYKANAEAVNPLPAKGYEFLGWEITNGQGTSLCEDPTAVEIVEDTTFTAKFGPLDYGYVVKFVDEDGNALATEVRGPETTFGTEVSADAIEITGYECDETSKTITIDVENNEIVFVYKKKVYEVKFETDGNGVITGTDTFNVKYAEKVEKVPSQKANKGYEFIGWTMTTSTGTTNVEDPAQVEITENTIFTAHYEYVQTSGDINNPDNDPVRGNEDIDKPGNDNNKDNNKNNNNKNNSNKNNKNKNNQTLNPEQEDIDGGSETLSSGTSPKTGYQNVLAMLFAIMMAAFSTMLIALRRVAKN